MARSAPSAVHAAHFSSLPAVTMTVAPNALPSWMAEVPMPDEPPWTSSVSPALRSAAVEDVGPDREERLGDRSRFGQREAGWHREGGAIVDGAILGIAAAGYQRRHVIADGKRGDGLTAGDDFAGDLQAENIGDAGRRRIAAAALRDVRPIDAGRCHLDQDLVGSWHRRRALHHLQHLGTAWLAGDDGGHRFWNRHFRRPGARRPLAGRLT